MKLKGAYSSGKTYAVGDVVISSENQVYHLQHPAPSGTPPTNTLYWGMLDQDLATAVLFIMDAIGIMNITIEGLNIPDNLSEDVLVLKSSTASSEKEFAITVDDDGDLTATEIVPESAGEGGEGGGT